MEASRIPIDDRSTGFRKGDPLVADANFFTGQYDAGSGFVGFTVTDIGDWYSFWHSTVGETPPGPLPKGAKAVMLAQHHADDPVSFFPEKVARDDSGISIHWQRRHIGEEADNRGRKSRFAVLVVPDVPDSQIYRDIFPAEERRAAAERFADELKIITEGMAAPVAIIPVAKLRRKPEFLKL
jgi:hypothetical protein